MGARIYANKDDTNPTEVVESQVEITIDAPTYEIEDWDPEVGIPEDVEF